MIFLRNIIAHIFRLLNIEEDEKKAVSILIVQSVFLGAFYGTFDISAHTLFLTKFGEALIPRAYLISGLVGIGFTAFYSFLQNKIKFTRLILITFAFISLLPFLLRLGFSGSQSMIDATIFMVFILLGPLNIVALVAFWGMAGRMFTLRQGKRLFGLIGSGQIIGIIIASYAIPFFPKTFLTEDLLLLCAFSILIALIIQFYINANLNFNTEKPDPSVQKKKRKKESFKILFTDKYINTMSVFVLLSMLVTFFISYSFLSVANDKYPNEASLKDFLSVFTGTLMIFGLIVKTFIYSKLMKNYGLKITILVLPFVLVLFTIFSIFSGSFLAYKSTGESLFGQSPDSKFIFFFLLISLSRLFSLSLRDSIELPAFKTLYQSLDAKIRHDVQAKIDGTVNEFSALFSGLLLLVFSYIFSDKVILFSFVLLIFLALWIHIGFKVYKEYKLSLQKSIFGTIRKKDKKEIEKLLVQNILTKNTDSNLLYFITILKENDFHLYFTILEKLLWHKSENVRNAAIRRIAKEGDFFLFKQLQKKQTTTQAINTQLVDACNSFQKAVNQNYDTDKILSITKSKKLENRIFAARIIAHFNKTEFNPYLILLLKDINKKVVHEAILSVLRTRQPKMASILVDFIAHPTFYAKASVTLIAIGEAAIEKLEQAYRKTDVTKNEQLRIIRIISKIGGKAAIKSLLNKINTYNREIQREIIVGLQKCNYKITKKEIWNFHQIIKQNIEIIAWILNIKNQYKPKNKNLLKDAIEEAYKQEMKYLFQTLSVSYGAKLIENVEKNLEIGTNESIGYAIELLDLYLAEEIKDLIFILLEDISLSEKMKRFQEYFPLQKMSHKALLLEIINKNVNYISNYAKACAINDYFETTDSKLTNAIVAQLFNTNALIQECAAINIFKENPEIYKKSVMRLAPEKRKKLGNVLIKMQSSTKYLLFDKLVFLSKTVIFKNLPTNTLLATAMLLNTKMMKKEEVFFENQDENMPTIFFVVEGKLQLTYNNRDITYAKNDFFDYRYFKANTNKEIKITAKENSMLHYINEREINELSFDTKEIFNNLLNYYTQT